jgi:CheY-like chemotaxis protein
MEPKNAARVLVVDDEVRALRLMSRVLGSSAIVCRTAESAAEALAILRQAAEIDVVVSDILHADDRSASSSSVRAQGVRRAALAATVAGHGTGVARDGGRRDAPRGSDYLFKPIEPKSLRESVQHALTRPRASGKSAAPPGIQPGHASCSRSPIQPRRSPGHAPHDRDRTSGRREHGRSGAAAHGRQQPANAEAAAEAAGSPFQHFRRSRDARARLGNARRN